MKFSLGILFKYPVQMNRRASCKQMLRHHSNKNLAVYFIQICIFYNYSYDGIRNGTVASHIGPPTRQAPLDYPKETKANILEISKVFDLELANSSKVSLWINRFFGSTVHSNPFLSI